MIEKIIDELVLVFRLVRTIEIEITSITIKLPNGDILKVE